ncbi:MAG: endonuclease [Bacteroidales bacterium]|nr:endonuclease [Bacteroidales bacterium]
MKHLLRQFALPILLIAFSISVSAQIPNGYYNNANGKTGDELKTALHDIIKGHHVVSYGGLLNAFAYTDCKPNGKIWDIYSNIEYSPSSGLCGDYEQEGDCWNREHTWPQSWFNESTTPRSDLFHVYPTDGYVNGQRSNYPYGEVNNPIYTSGNGSKLGPCVTTGYSGRVFEPIDEYKGDIARGFFYMSVRYSGEDDDWGTSGMTNKSEILPWAMTMLLRWSDEDPVSDKEIARNNAVYGYQSNRNPFIDHPEYARMIWDPTWTQGASYNITCATGLSHGSVSAPESALEGSTVAITATPTPGYMVGAYSVYKTGDTSTTVTVSSNGTFTMPGYAVTVSATFVQNNTMYNIALGTVSHGSINASASTALSGTNITLTATPATGYSLYSWYVFKSDDMNTSVAVSGNSFTMPAFNVTVMATFVLGEVSTGDYVKVTAAPSDWSGEYLIVYEGGNLAFNGGLTTLDATGNTISVSINNNTIVADATTNAAKFTIAAISGGYSIQSASGYYIGQTSDANGLKSSQTTTYTNTITYSNGNVNIVSSGAYMRYNNQTDQARFRYFKSSTYTNQKAIQLYKKSEPSATPTHNIYFNQNGGTGSMNDQTVNEFEPTALHDNAFTRTGFVFEGWNTAADGTGDYYADGATVTLLDDLTLYAQWNQLFNITLVQANHGSIVANATQAIEEAEIVLTATPDPCYALNFWMVTDALGNPVNVTENQFEMPANDVTVTAVFMYSPQSFVKEYQLVTSTNQLVAGHTYLIVNVANGKALGTTQNSNNRSAAAVTIEDDIIASIDNTVCELTLGGGTGAWTFFDEGYGNNGGYLYAASSNNNYLRTQATNNNNGKWSITIGANGAATITAQGSNTRNLLKYNNSSDIFACYASSSTQLDVYLFRRTEIYDYPTEQINTLSGNWTWWSTYLDIDLAQLEEALGDNCLNIVSQNGTLSYIAGAGWDGANFESLDLSRMYMLDMTAACQLALTGTPVNPKDCPISINPGFNWMGYPLAQSTPINQALSGLNASAYDRIISHSSYAIYSGTSWIGSLKELDPGVGYIYFSNASSNKVFYFPQYTE